MSKQIIRQVLANQDKLHDADYLLFLEKKRIFYIGNIKAIVRYFPHEHR